MKLPCWRVTNAFLSMTWLYVTFTFTSVATLGGVKVVRVGKDHSTSSHHRHSIQRRQATDGADHLAICPPSIERVDCFMSYLRVYARLRKAASDRTNVRSIVGKRGGWGPARGLFTMARRSFTNQPTNHKRLVTPLEHTDDNHVFTKPRRRDETRVFSASGKRSLTKHGHKVNNRLIKSLEHTDSNPLLITPKHVNEHNMFTTPENRNIELKHDADQQRIFTSPFDVDEKRVFNTQLDMEENRDFNSILDSRVELPGMYDSEGDFLSSVKNFLNVEDVLPSFDNLESDSNGHFPTVDDIFKSGVLEKGLNDSGIALSSLKLLRSLKHVFNSKNRKRSQLILKRSNDIPKLFHQKPVVQEMYLFDEKS